MQRDPACGGRDPGRDGDQLAADRAAWTCSMIAAAVGLVGGHRVRVLMAVVVKEGVETPGIEQGLLALDAF